MLLKQREEIKKARALFLRVARGTGADLNQNTLYNLLVKAYLKGRLEATQLAQVEITSDEE